MNDGATIIGPMPDFATWLTDFPASDAEVREIADRLWNGKTAPGRVIADKTAREVLQADGIGQDLQFTGGGEKTAIDYIHRRDGDADIYFIANRSRTPENLQFAFRVAGKAPQLWDAVTGDVHWASDYQSDEQNDDSSVDARPVRIAVRGVSKSRHPLIQRLASRINPRRRQHSRSMARGKSNSIPSGAGPPKLNFPSSSVGPRATSRGSNTIPAPPSIIISSTCPRISQTNRLRSIWATSVSWPRCC